MGDTPELKRSKIPLPTPTSRFSAENSKSKNSKLVAAVLPANKPAKSSKPRIRSKEFREPVPLKHSSNSLLKLRKQISNSKKIPMSPAKAFLIQDANSSKATTTHTNTNTIIIKARPNTAENPKTVTFAKQNPGPRLSRHDRFLYTAQAPETSIYIPSRDMKKRPQSAGAAYYSGAAFLRPNASNFARIAALSVINNKGSRKKINNPKFETEIVLPPRFGPGAKTSNTSVESRPTLDLDALMAELDLEAGDSVPPTKPKDTQTEAWDARPHTPIKKMKVAECVERNRDLSDFHCIQSNLQTNKKLKSPVDSFAPPKAVWVLEAMQKLVENGTITCQLVDLPGFQKKIGDLYDIAVDRKYSEISNCLKNLVLPDHYEQQRSPLSPLSSGLGTGSNKGKKMMKPARSREAKNAGNPNAKLKVGFGSGAGVGAGPAAGANSRPSSAPKKQRKYKSLEDKVSDILLHMLLKSMVVPANETCNVSTNTEDDDFPTAKSEEDLEDGTNVDLKQFKNCIVFEGKICPVESPKKLTNSFASLAGSKKKTNPDLQSYYFRKVADVRGFESEEISLKYSDSSATKIFVEGKRSETTEKSYRFVREMVSLPAGLQIENLKIMRGKNNGKLVFEEI